MIKRIILIGFLSVLMSAFTLVNAQTKIPEAAIRYNQLGYFPQGVKKAVVVNSTAGSFTLKNLSGTTVFKGNLIPAGYWNKSGEQIKIADFSSFNKPGKYVLFVKDAGQTCSFEIKSNLYHNTFKAALKSYYLMRASVPIEKKYAGIYHRKTGHPDTLCYFHPSTRQLAVSAPSPGGWYDAGDYNKYVVNAGVSVGTLLCLYELYPNLAEDGFSNIPESHNGKSDLLDEIKYELDWVLSMQAPDGAAYFKLTSKNFSGFIMPDKDKSKRFFVGKSTASTLNFTAMAAMASRLYRTYDSTFSNKCLRAAEKAWQWTLLNPNIVYKNPKDISTGEYGDSDFTEEFWWAAAELYLVTQKQDYLNFLTSHEPYLKWKPGESWRVFVGNLGSFSLLLSHTKLPDELRSTLQKKLQNTANLLLEKQSAIPYRIPVDEFVWGSNSDILNAAMILAYAYQLWGEQKYLGGIIETTDYIFGKNATGYSFITGFGCKQIMNPHNRISSADGIEKPLPGLVAGGPNQNRNDDKAKVPYGVVYPDKHPAKSYVDRQASYASNENAINWNAPAVFILGFLLVNQP